MVSFLTYENVARNLSEKGGKTWVITGIAGFIGSHLARRLLELNQNVIGIDFETRYLKNLEFLKTEKGFPKRFKYIGADIAEVKQFERFIPEDSRVVHLAALGSAPRSLKKPARTFVNNVLSFNNVLNACRDREIKLVYASSSSGQHCLSPYGASKSSCDRLALSYFKAFGYVSVPLRFFNIFGPGQIMTGDYAPAIGKWIHQVSTGEPPTIYGKCSRDFTYIENAVQAIILASIAEIGIFQVFDIGHGVSVDTSRVLNYIIQNLNSKLKPKREIPRLCDPAFSESNLTPAINAFGYRPIISVYEGVDKYIDWYRQNDIKDKIDLYGSS